MSIDRQRLVRRMMRRRGLIQSRIGVGVHRVPLSDSFDWEMRRLIELHRIDTVLDVGANGGGFVNRLRRHVRFEGAIHCFEPGPIVATLRSSAAGDSRVVVHETALGSSDAVAELLVTRDSDLSSFHQPLQVARDLFPGAAIDHRLSVTQRRLDSMSTELAIAPRSCLLKVDTQGHDHEVLDGAGELMRQFPVVLVEASIVQLYEHQPAIEETIARMRQFGLLLCGAYPVSRRDGVVPEFDCLFSRRIAA